jgi:serine/threonine protein kinase
MLPASAVADDTLLEYGGVGRRERGPSETRFVCSACGTRWSSDARFCPFDGEPLSEAPKSDLKDPLLGTMVDQRYQLIEVLGEGGMGTVYRARHTSLARDFALKVLRRDLAQDPDLSRRFVHEARAASAVSHPFVVKITDFGQLHTGQPYFVMELLVGDLLSSVIRESGAMTAERTVIILRQVAEALGAAHQAGVVHCDLKPDNIHLGRAASGLDSVTVLDFGLAKVAGTSRLTRAGMVFGTPHYMSPEQAAGEPADHRADIYALGIVGYQMLTARLPFEADSFMGVLTKHMYVTPTPPSEFAPDPEALGALEDVILRCLEKKPDRRYPSMTELLGDLDRVTRRTDEGGLVVVPSQRPGPRSFRPLVGEEWDASDSSGTAPVRRRVSRNAVLVALAFGLGAMVGIGLLVSARGRPHATPAASQPVSASANSIASAPAPGPSLATAPAPAPSDAGPGPSPSQPKPNLAPKIHKPARESGTARRKVQSVGEIVNPWER